MTKITKIILILLCIAAGGVFWKLQQGSGLDRWIKTLFFGPEQDEPRFRTAGCSARASIREVENAAILLLDVRNSADFDDARIHNMHGFWHALVISVPAATVEKFLKQLPKLSKKKPIVVYGQNYLDTTPYTVAKRLIDAGFTDVKIFGGGMAEWYQKALAIGYNEFGIEGPMQQPSLKVPVERSTQPAGTIPILDAQELQQLLFDRIAYYTPLFGSSSAMIEEADLLLVNVLDRTDFDDAHIRSLMGMAGSASINVPGNDPVEIEKAILLLSKHKPMVLYGANYLDMTPYTVANRLVDAGFTNVQIFSGGMAEWYQFKQAKRDYTSARLYRIVGPAKKAYLKQPVKTVVNNKSNVPTIGVRELEQLIQDTVKYYSTGALSCSETELEPMAAGLAKKQK